jgi:very-short-patch-repair endonuclease
MKRISNPIETTELCSYGCGNIAKFINGSKRIMCCKSCNSCPANRQKNSKKVIEAYQTGKRKAAKEVYANLPQETKDRMNWAKGLTKETNSSVALVASKLKGRPGISRPHTDETKAKLSKFRTEYLKDAKNRKNLGRHKRSWMETEFEKYLTEHNITGWETEKHFWNEELRKNYFPDFLFEASKLIIELDGTQHRKTVEQDAIRDKWFTELGYTVTRIPHSEFKERLFSGKGFIDLLGS